MYRLFTILAIALFSSLSVAGAQWSQPGYITYMSLASDTSHVYIQLSSPKAGSCLGRFYMLKLVENPLGSSMFSMLLTHKASQEKLMVYTTGSCLSSYENPEVSSLRTEGDNKSY